MLKALAIAAENRIASLALGGIMLIPLAEIVSRKFLGAAIPGSSAYASVLTLWLGMLGAAIAARDGKLLTLATGEFLPKGRVTAVAHVIAGAVGAMIATILMMGAIVLVQSDRLAGDVIAEVTPKWIADLALPVGFGLIAVRLAWHASPHRLGRAIAAGGIVAGLLLNQYRGILENQSFLPWLLLVLAAGVLGAPIFALLGGIALFASLVRGTPPAVLPLMAYQQLTTSTGIAAIPLFTLAGFLLAEGRSSERLLRLFRGWAGWAPGGTAIAAATLCAFFTLFTGGSGVTILVLGGLLLPALVGSGYRERFSIGLLTASGSLGLLFPLSLPLMLYGIVSQKASIEDLFIGGIATLVESAPIAALYTVIIQRYVNRDLPTWKDVFRVAADCVALVGGVLLILGVAAGLTDYFVYEQIPTRLVEWTQAHVHTRVAFLLGLNVFLLLVGTVMDIFSAIVVVVPLILPLAEFYGINVVHLGIIFIANLELGFLHPPLGLNLLLASVRFKKPVLEVTWATLPMFGILALGVLLITYVPWLPLGILHWMGRL